MRWGLRGTSPAGIDGICRVKHQRNGRSGVRWAPVGFVPIAYQVVRPNVRGRPEKRERQSARDAGGSSPPLSRIEWRLLCL